MTAQSITLRHADASDAPVLRDLADLESRLLPGGPFLVAEVAGEVQATISLSDGTVLADPFRQTAHLAELLRSHATAQAAAQRRARHARRRPRLAFGL